MRNVFPRFFAAVFATVSLVSFSNSVAGKEETAPRPALEKAPYKKMVWMHANSWFPPSKDRVYCPLGGPDVAAKRFDNRHVWEDASRLFASYGVNGFQYEVSIWNPQPSKTFISLLDSLKADGNGMKAVYFIPIHMPAFKENMVKFISISQKELSHPNYYRLGGRPVVVIYRAWAQKPEKIKEMIDAVEAKYGHMIWLAEFMLGTSENVRKYMPVFDGITMYGNWTLTNQKEYFERLSTIMHKEFPEKIFECGVQNLNCDHFHYGGVAPRNLDKYLASWETTLAAKPDSITLTNMFDHSENSHHLPSWAWEDILMRISQYYIRQWRGEPQYKTPANIRPEIYVINSANTIIGWKAHFDLISFPSASGVPETVDFSIVNGEGKLLKSFGKIKLDTNRMDVQRFEVDTTEFANEPALYPKVRWQVFPKGTQLVAGFRPWMLYYASGTESVLKLQSVSQTPGVSDTDWMMNETPPGKVLLYPEDGIVCVTAHAVPMFGNAMNHSKNNRIRLLRNGREFMSYPGGDLNFTRFFTIPNPLGAVDWYNLELENEEGFRFTTMPIMVASKTMRTGKTIVPIPSEDMKIREFKIDANRIPFFYYPCDTDDGRLLRDVSGYSHDGFIAGKSFQGGHLPMTGYRHEHFGAVPNINAADPVFKRDSDGRGFYRFSGKGYIMVMGGTIPPYASTVEMSVRLSKYLPGGIFGTGNGQLNIEILKDGRVKVVRCAEQEGMACAPAVPGNTVNLISKEPVPLNQWVRIAVVYDLENVSLYIDGQLQGQSKFTPRQGQEWFNAVVLGAKGTFPWANRKDPFTGDLSRIRIYARNLTPGEFLK